MGNRNQGSNVESLFARSAAALQQGDAKTAARGLRKVVDKLPQSAAAWYNLALAHQHLGENHKAIRAYEKALKLSPQLVDGWVNLGLSCKENGQLAEAGKAVESALAIDADHPRALNLAATLAAESGEHDRAGDLFRRCLEREPGNQEARFNLANLLLETGNPEKSLDALQPLLPGAPGDVRFPNLQARIMLQLRRFEDVAKIIDRLQREHGEEEQVLRLELAFREAIRDHFGVVAAAQKLVDRFPEDASAWNSLGGGYFQMDGIDRAAEYFKKALTLDPDHPEYENNMGLAYSSLGKKENAERHYRNTLALQPDHADAYRNLVTMKRFRNLDDPDAVALQGLWEREDVDDRARTRLAFALGKVLDDCGEYERAFEVYRQGNELQFCERRIDLDAYFSHMDRVIDVLDQWPQNVSNIFTSPTPVFILGMPRSGTTLVEQIISRHPQVTGCGELPCIERAIGRLEKGKGTPRVYPDSFPQIASAEFEEEVREYLGWVEKLHGIGTPYFTDKMPFNFVHIWLIRAMFPDAPIIHCDRHPMDAITSNYFQLYGSDIDYVYDLEALANYTVRHHRLMQHWMSLFEGDIHNVRYEELVGEVESGTRALIDAVELPWDDACLDPESSGAAVRTASIWQVRQGVYTRSRERWRHYEKQLQPALDILVAEGVLDRDGSVLS